MFEFVDMSTVCDSNYDCSTRDDEKYCPDRFYCEKSDAVWVTPDKVCNGFKDCENGQDECAGCSRGFLSSDENIIKNNFLLSVCVTVMACTLMANCYNLWEIDYQTQEHDHVRVERVLKVTLIAYDLAMALYLAILLGSNIRYYGRYCNHDSEWRSGILCDVMGVVFSTSAHGSLLIVLIMSVTRAYKCAFPFSSGILRHRVYALTALLTAVNLTHAILPVIQVNEIQDHTRSDFHISSLNPFTRNTNNISHVWHIHSLFFPDNVNSSLVQKFADLRSISNDPTLFQVHDFSLYGWSSVCVPDLFNIKQDPVMVTYKLIYLGILSLVLLVISVCYAVILWSLISSHRADDTSAVANVSQKVAIIVGVKFVTWMFVAAIMVYAMATERLVARAWYEVIAVSILPLNSCLNPVFHSDLYQRLTEYFKKPNELVRPEPVGNTDRQSPLSLGRDMIEMRNMGSQRVGDIVVESQQVGDNCVVSSENL
eukprot:sb/3464246/